MDQQKSTYTIAGAIVVAGMIIAGAVVYTGLAGAPAAPAAAPAAQETADPLAAMPEVTEDDHIRGSMDAPVKIVTYSDFGCPFCQRFHNTMMQILSEYEQEGTVAWVYRHFPLRAPEAALASECAATLGGNDMFWRYTDILNDEWLANSANAAELLPDIATRVGIDPAALTACMEQEETRIRIDQDTTGAVQSGGQGTPWSILEGPDGTRYPINGAQPIETVRQLIELAQG